MDVFVFGVARSGTTLTYNLLQGIFDQLYKDGFRSIYEPYIWDMEKFNRPYKETKQLFGKTDSLSVEGIYSHVKTPLFVNSVSPEQYLESDFYRNFSASTGCRTPRLAKLIRGNGRMPIFRALNPGARFILVIRNPVDVVNSVKDKFSFYGDDFYPSDLPRFCEYLQKENKLFMDEKVATWAQQQGEYCYQMNRAALEFSLTDQDTLVIEYDTLARNRPATVTQICHFLGIPFVPEFAEEPGSAVGPTTPFLALSQSEFESLVFYDDLYTELCDRYNISREKSAVEVKNQYDGKCTEADFDTSYQGLTTNRLRVLLRQKTNQIRKLENQLAKKAQTDTQGVN